MKTTAPLRALRNGLSLRGLSLESLAYALTALAASLWVTHEFFSSLKAQLFLAQARTGLVSGPPAWSAPLDDVFIHFDFARSAARGFPLEWSQGNGYSSGGTSLLYPFVLAFGYIVGYREGQLMLWAGIVACLSVWATLLCAWHMCRHLPPWSSLVLPPALISVGALSWTLASGMEVAFFLATWGLSFLAWEHFWRTTTRETAPSIWRPAALLGLANLVLVATRPEAAVIVAILSLSAIAAAWRASVPLPRLAFALALSATPGALVVLGQTLANYWLTGESAAAGALVKLELHHPYMDAQQVWDAWWFHLKYQVLRVTDYHFSSVTFDLTDYFPFSGVTFNAFGISIGPFELSNISSGWLIWALAMVPLASKKTRRYSLFLWACIVSWLCIVALNGQVRWQNERYTMPAVAWLLLSAGLGIALLLGLLSRNAERRPWKMEPHWLRWSVAGLAVVCATFVVLHQSARYRGQLWFFGRASRNIYEQHIEVARRLTSGSPLPKRVLVGDAGAIPYVSDISALDIIGLGGYQMLPFARATRQGVGAAIELIQRMRPEERPDLMALYPTWWGDLPSWFGQRLFEVSVRGNVICGGRDKVVYKSRWETLDVPPLPPALASRVSAELDIADLISEKQSAWKLTGTAGYVSMKMLPHPADSKRDLWEAGRLLTSGSVATFALNPGKRELRKQATELVLLVAPSQEARLQIRGKDTEPAPVSVSPGNAWLYLSVPAPQSAELELHVLSGEVVLYHVWGLTD